MKFFIIFLVLIILYFIYKYLFESIKYTFNDIKCRQNGIIIIDNFYSNPDEIRAKIFKNTFMKNQNLNSGGLISSYNHQSDKLFNYINKKKNITPDSGFFRLNTNKDKYKKLVHQNLGKDNIIIYMTPITNYKVGTTLWKKKKITGSTNKNNLIKICEIPMKYNRMVIFSGDIYHTPGNFHDMGKFGTDKYNGRLVQIFWAK